MNNNQTSDTTTNSQMATEQTAVVGQLPGQGIVTPPNSLLDEAPTAVSVNDSFARELGIPAPDAEGVSIRYFPYPVEGDFDPQNWPKQLLRKKEDGWWILDFPSIPDGTYEYHFEVTFPLEYRATHGLPDAIIVADPYAEELVRFSGYRGILHIRNGLRIRPAFSWENEFSEEHPLPENNQMVIYELPMHWVESTPDAADRNVGLGTFDKAIYERLSYIRDLGCNAIELLPIQDSADTLNWGYGTRFFYAPDFDMGAPFDLKLFIKKCHQNGIRVILDVVMNHARECPLKDLSPILYFIERQKMSTGEDRNGWGGDLFQYNDPRNGYYPAREWHCAMAEFWVKEYHIDGFRIDEFRGIDNWDFIWQFRDRAWQAYHSRMNDNRFIVIAEDSAQKLEAVQPFRNNLPVVDAHWNFGRRAELRRLCTNTIFTQWMEPSRSDRVKSLIQLDRYTDLSQHIIYPGSHDVKDFDQQRLYPYFLLMFGNLSELDPAVSLKEMEMAIPVVFEQIFSAFALTMTIPGIPMFLAGEEFADLHDLPHDDDRQKMSDPVNWDRMNLPRHAELLQRVKQLIQKRKTVASLQQNEVAFFGYENGGFHPSFNDNSGERVFAYYRTGGRSVDEGGQVAVVCNAGPTAYLASEEPASDKAFWLKWPWSESRPVEEIGRPEGQQPILFTKNDKGEVEIELKPFQTRVFQIG